MFPGVVTEARDATGQLRRTIHFERLKEALGEAASEPREAYDFTWVGKKAAALEAGKPIRKTLRPCPAESKNWDTTGNLYIEGDNLEVLKLLQESYLGKVKMIYIDPPYNTGNDFIYRDNFAAKKEDYEAELGIEDEETGEHLFKNTETNGRFHSDWCSMIYSRLLIARSLLREDGAIFISIDDGEVAQLIKICDEVFGEENFITKFIWHNNKKGRQMDKHIKTTCEYILMYSKNESKLITFSNQVEVDIKNYSLKDNISFYKKGYPLHNGTAAFDVNNRPNLCYSIYYNPEFNEAITIDEKKRDNDTWEINTSECGISLIKKGFKRIIPKWNEKYKKQRVWRWGMEKFRNEYQQNLIFVKEPDGWYVYQKDRVSEDGLKEQKFVNYIDVDTSRGRSEMNVLFQNKVVFDFPKPIDIIKLLTNIFIKEDSIILDFFSGSATTAHAVIQLNAEDAGKRKFIMVQWPESTPEASEAAKAGFKNICEIGKERIRRAGEKIVAELKKNKKADDASLFEGQESGEVSMPDIGFRVFKVDSSNVEDIYYNPDAIAQDLLEGVTSHIKPDRSSEDLLFGCLLDWGLPLSLPCRSEQLAGVTVHTYNDGDLVACFDPAIPEKAVFTIAQRAPLRAVFCDACFADSAAKINVFEIFKTISPGTEVKVI